MTRSILLIAAGLAVASGETLCNNSLFKKPTEWGASSSVWGGSFSSVKQSVSPVPPPSKVSAVCKYYAKQPEVCCSADTLDAIEYVAAARSSSRILTMLTATTTLNLSLTLQPTYPQRNTFAAARKIIADRWVGYNTRDEGGGRSGR